MKKYFLFSLLAAFIFISCTAQAQIINIPDPNFKNYLVGNTQINTNSDAEIQLSEAVSFNDTIHCRALQIFDLTGIENFTNLRFLDCGNNNLGAIDLSLNTSLEMLHCDNTNISSLNLYLNTDLKRINCSNNPFLTSLDLDSNYNIQTIDCSFCNINTLQISNNPFVDTVRCQKNNLTSLATAGKMALKYLNCSDNEFANLLTNGNPLLQFLDCSDNLLSSLSVSNNPSLLYLNCSKNPLQTINVSLNTALTDLLCANDSLSSLSVNTNTNLRNLNCSKNQLSTILLNPLNNLRQFIGSQNQFMNINFLNNTFLRTADVSSNYLTNLDLSANTQLTKLYCQNNQIDSLNFDLLKQLVNIDASDNTLKKLHFKNGNNTNVLSFKIENNPDLNCVTVDNPTYSDTSWKNIISNNFAVDQTTFFDTNCFPSSVSNSMASNFLVYPNPAVDKVYIIASMAGHLRLYDMSGKILLKKELQFGQNMLHIETLQAGFYTIVFNNEANQVFYKKIIKQ